jgi:tetratricopeptide (TPR) repeat protein
MALDETSPPVEFFFMNRTLKEYQVSLICIFLVVSTLAVYWRVIYSDFVNFDDPIYVTENEHVMSGLSGANVVWAFTSKDVSYWHPLTWLSHMLDCELYGLRAGMHHLTSLILHAANSLLLFFVFKRMTGAVWRSAFVAAFFALHPLNVDSVAWITERKNVLSTLFWLLTMWAYAGYAYRGGVGRYLLVLVLFGLGTLAKPMLVTLPFVMLLLDYWPLGRYRLEPACDEKTESQTGRSGLSVFLGLLREKIPLFVLSAVAVYFFSSSGHRAGTKVSEELVPVKLRIANAVVSYVAYIGKMILPRKMAVFYPYPDRVPTWEVIVALLLLVAASAFVIAQLKRRGYLATGWAWYLGTMVPVIGLFQVGLWPAMADRWAYVPLIGLFVIIAWGIGDLAAKWRLRSITLAIPAGACLSVLMVCTWLQVGHWRDGSTLFRHAINVTHGNYIAHYNLGNILLKEGKTDEAIEHYRKAAEIHVNYVDAHYNLGIAFSARKKYAEAIEAYRSVLKLRKDHKRVLARLADALAKNGQLDEAVSYYNRALERKGEDTEVLNNLALALAKKGKPDEAIKCYNKSLEIDPNSVEVLNNLGNAWIDKKEFGPAVRCYEKALSLNPGFAETYYNLANALKQMGELEKAVLNYRRALEFKPEDVDVHYGLGLALAELKAYDEAALHYRKAIELNPNFAQAYYNLGITFVNQNRVEEAIEQFRQVLRIHPNDAEMHCNLGTLLAKQGRVSEAVEEFRTALRLEPNLSRARDQLEGLTGRSSAEPR